MLYYINEKHMIDGKIFNNYRQSVIKAMSILYEANVCNFNLAVHTKDNLNGILNDVLGNDICNKLKNKKIFQTSKITIGLITEKIPPIHSCAIIACFISYKYLNKLIDSYPNVNIIYIPWTEEEERIVSMDKKFKKL